MSIKNIINLYRDQINSQLLKIYSKGPITIYKPIQYVLSGGGKRIRPLLSILTAEACGGKKENILNAALAIEVLHNFTLVHDDIMDQDLVRHGKKTVHEKWDVGVAILSGDAMLALALKLINQSPHSHEQMNIFIDGLLAVCEGQALDKEFEKNNDVTLENYLDMINKKTAHMIGMSSEIGSLILDLSLDESYHFKKFGKYIGLAYQIQDDLLEVFAD